MGVWGSGVVGEAVWNKDTQHSRAIFTSSLGIEWFNYNPQTGCDDSQDPVDTAKDFVLRKFMSLKHDEDYRDIYAHFITAANTDSPIQLKQAVMDHIIRTRITDAVL